MKYKLTSMLLALSLMCSAQYSDKELYQAYLTSDLTLWGEYIKNTNWNTLSVSDKERMLNYQYGYVANILSNKDKSPKQQLALFKERIAEMADMMPKSTILSYESAAAAYEIQLGSWKVFSLAKDAFTKADEAVKLDSLNSIALTLAANVKMYAPKMVGGDKEVALKYFLLSEKRYREIGWTTYNWNYRALQLCIAQCYEKTGHKEKAIAKCEEILQEEPNFEYIKHDYLPRLQGKEPTKTINRTEINSDAFTSIGAE